MKNLLCAILILAFPAVYYGQAKKTAGPLDGKIFVIDLFKEGKKKALDSDEIKFTAGKFKSIYFQIGDLLKQVCIRLLRRILPQPIK